MRRVLAAFALLLLPGLALAEQPRTNAFSTAGAVEWGQALTDAGYFGIPRTATASLATCNSANKGAFRFDTTSNTLKVCNGTAWGELSSSLSSGLFTGLVTFGSAVDALNSVRLGETAGCVVGEGATADGFETSLCFGDATADNTLTVKGTATGVTLSTTTGNPQVGAGAGTGVVTLGGVVCVDSASHATTGTAEEILVTCTLPANSLSVNGKGIRVTTWGTTAANANAKVPRLRFGGIGGTALVAVSTTASGGSWRLVAEVLRSGAATQTGSGFGVVGAGVVFSTSTSAPTQTLSGAVDLVLTGTTVTASGDLTATGFLVEFFN